MKIKCKKCEIYFELSHECVDVKVYKEGQVDEVIVVELKCNECKKISIYNYALKK